jgi:hypothetical protein
VKNFTAKKRSSEVTRRIINLTSCTFADIPQILFSTRRFSKITPPCRSIACLQRRYREAAKQRSFAKKQLNFFAQLRCFAPSR